VKFPRLTPFRAACLTGLYIGLWCGVLVLFHDEQLVELVGWSLTYLIGLAWTVYLVEREARRFELKRNLIDTSAFPQIPVGGELPSGRRGGSNPLDPAAWYYGRSNQRFRQSLLMLVLYSNFFVLVYLLAHLRFGGPDSENVYELPAGGGSESIKASSVKVQKVVRKKYVINPFSSIVFAVPPIDQIDVKLTEETANRYQAGQGAGGLGEGEGDGGGFGGGTGKGKIRFICIRHSDKTWNKNHGIAGDRNLLAELVIREPKLQGKVADETESMDISTLATFPTKKSPPLIYIGGMHSFSPTPAEKKILERYLTEQHGMILGDNLGGAGFHNSFIAAMNEITHSTWYKIAQDDRIHTKPYELLQFPYVVAHGGTTPLGWKNDGRWGVYYHPGALSDAWRDDRAGIKKNIAEMCYQLGINILYYAHREYSQWLQSQKP
jgi:hypothetical protein